MLTMTVHGDKALLWKFALLEQAARKRVASKALRAGAKLVKAAMRMRAPEQGQIRRSLGVKVKSSKKGARGWVGVRLDFKGRREGVEPFRLAHFFEFGTQERHTAAGKYTGRQRATPFMRPAWAAVSGTTLSTITNEVREGIEREAKS